MMKKGSLFKAVGGIFLFFQISFILSFLLNLSQLHEIEDWFGKLLYSVFVFGIPGICLFRKGKQRRTKAEIEMQLRQRGILLPAKKLWRASNFMRGLGWMMLIFVELVLLGNMMIWSDMQEEVEMLFVFVLLLGVPGALLVWASTKIDRSADEKAMVEQYRVQLGNEMTDHDEWEPYGRAAAKSAAVSKPPLSKIVNCTGCGAQIKVQPDSVAACEYCGSMMAYDAV
ncbi:hypothetical protein AZ66_04725 [Paenibacillus sp. E194]|uniref:hypothetical protein n=1 Tax=Paenibacillus sp. E194 TaxID=1458845 RepID=UPI0005C97B2F|nr:hypothetical protein [Paenibacillus sp. E194]KJB88903.1 hypothetical protein AZ66_04725 [Paenibacillus sp. E194]